MFTIVSDPVITRKGERNVTLEVHVWRLITSTLVPPKTTANTPFKGFCVKVKFLLDFVLDLVEGEVFKIRTSLFSLIYINPYLSKTFFIKNQLWWISVP